MTDNISQRIYIFMRRKTICDLVLRWNVRNTVITPSSDKKVTVINDRHHKKRSYGWCLGEWGKRKKRRMKPSNMNKNLKNLEVGIVDSESGVVYSDLVSEYTERYSFPSSRKQTPSPRPVLVIYSYVRDDQHFAVQCMHFNLVWLLFHTEGTK